VVLVISILLNVILQPYYHPMDNRQESIALAGLLLILYVASTEGQRATSGHWVPDSDSSSFLWVQVVSMSVLVGVLLVFTVTFFGNVKDCQKILGICRCPDATPVKRTADEGCCHRCGGSSESHDAEPEPEKRQVQYRVTVVTHESNTKPTQNSGIEKDLQQQLAAAKRANTAEWIHTVQTRLQDGIEDAGIDCNVYVAIRGDMLDTVGPSGECRHAWTGYMRLSQLNRDNFEPGACDVFTFSAPDVGTISRRWCIHFCKLYMYASLVILCRE
jgi:hypothetical protein